MATSTSTPTFLCSSTQRNSIQFTISSSPSTLPWPKTPKSRFSIPATQLGLGLFSPWSGLKHLGISIRHKSIKIERRGRSRGKVVHASLFGVGAPEALVIGVVALLVFGPKGLAEVARTLGKTLRSFQPTIRELQEVSREFKTTLEREIGLDDVPPSVQKNTSISAPPASTPANTETLDPNGTPKTTPYSSEEYLKITEEQLKAYGAQQQTLPQEEQSERQPQLQDDVPSASEPLNIGEFLVETQRKSSARQQEEQSVPREAQTLPQPGSQEAQLKSADPQQQEQLIPQEAQSQPQPESQETAPTTPQTKHESQI